MGSDTHGAEEQHFIPGSSARSQNLLQYLHFYCAKYKAKLQKKEKKRKETGLSRTYRKKEKKPVFLLHGTKRCKLRPKHQDTEVLQQSVILLSPHSAHAKSSLLFDY